MLRALVIALLLANVLFWAGTQDPVRLALGLPRVDHREPERLTRQVAADSITVLPASQPAGAAPDTAATAGAVSLAGAPVPACLVTDVLSEAELQAQQQALLKAGYHTGDWIDMQRERPGRWLLYMGRFENREQLLRKEEELRRLRLSFTPYQGAAELSPGLSLGEYGSADEAQLRLTQLQNRGVRTARVLPLAPGKTEHRLRLDQPGAAAQRLLATPLGARWQACAG
jgi:hypothetical protein